jgi:hypothetical protein
MRPLTWALKEVDPVGLHRQSGMHTCSGNLGIVKILRYIRSDMYTAKIHRKQKIGRKIPPPGQRGPVLKHTGTMVNPALNTIASIYIQH